MYEQKLNKKRQGEDGRHPIIRSLALHVAIMNYVSQIAFLLYGLRYFYHADEFQLMAET